MKWRRVNAIIYKHLVDKSYNRALIIQLLMIPVIAVLLYFFLPMRFPEPNMARQFLVALFAPMVAGMFPISIMASIIIEEKTVNTLRVLIMSTVKPLEYLTALIIYVFMIALVPAIFFGILGGYSFTEFLLFVAIFMTSVLTSLLLGGAIGIRAANQTGMAYLIMPVMLLMGIIPVLGMFNKSVYTVSQYLYTQQINSLYSDMSIANFTLDRITVILVSMIFFFILFMVSYKKNKFYA